MDDGSLSWIIIGVLYLFMAYFAVAETAFASVNKIKIRTALERGDERAEKALRILENFDKMVTTVLIGTNITHLAVASLVTVIVTREFGLSFVAIGTIITTLAVFFFGEMLPKSIAKRYSETLSLACADKSPLQALLIQVLAIALMENRLFLRLTVEVLHNSILCPLLAETLNAFLMDMGIMARLCGHLEAI